MFFFEDDGIGISEEKKEQIFFCSKGHHTLMRSLIFVREILDITGIIIITERVNRAREHGSRWQCQKGHTGV
jgi:hypothetical protein